MEKRPSHMLPVTIHLREGQRFSMLYKLSNEPNWRDPGKVAMRLAYTMGLSEVEERSVAEELARAIASYARHVHGMDKRREETRVLLQVYVRVGEEVFRDDLEVDLGALAGVTAMLAGTVQQYVATVCGDLNLDPKVWMTPITKKIYALLQEATEDLQRAPHEVKLMPLLEEQGAVRKLPCGLPRIENVNLEVDAMETEKDRLREEKRIAASRKRQEGQRSHHTSQSPC